MKRKKDSLDKLYDSVVEYIEQKGGKVVVIGGVEIARYPGDLEHNFLLSIRVTGKAPK